MRKAIFTLTLIAAVAGFSGCANVETASPLTTTQQQANSEITVRLAAGLATKAALVAVKDEDASKTAQIISDVSTAILNSTTDTTIDLTTVRVLAANEVGKIDASPKQKLVASQLVDAIGLLVQSRVDSVTLDPASRQASTLKLIRAAANGAKDATAIFLN